MTTKPTSPASKAERDGSKSTAEGEWEMRDGKWYRRDYYAIKPGEQQKQTVKVKCPNCPTYQERIASLTKERDELLRSVKEKEKTIIELRSRLEKLEAEAKQWIIDRRNLENKLQEKDIRIKELEERLRAANTLIETLRTTIKEKETIIIKINERMKALLDELARKQAEIDALLRIRLELEQRLAKANADLGRYEGLSKLIELLEEQIAFCKANHYKREIVLPPPPPEPQRWYYVVENPHFAQLFQTEQSYAGGDIVVDSLEGATVVNPEYYSQSERVAGNNRLRVRIVGAHFPVLAGTTGAAELFVRLRLGTATQFTQPRSAGIDQQISWHQDFVFVGVPVQEHPVVRGAFVSSNSLTIEMVSRVVGTANESIIGSGTIDLADLVYNLTRQHVLTLSGNGCIVNLRIRALDFGLLAGVQGSSVQQRSVIECPHDEFADSVFAVRREDMYGRMSVEDEERGLRERLMAIHYNRLNQLMPTRIKAEITATVQSSQASR